MTMRRFFTFILVLAAVAGPSCLSQAQDLPRFRQIVRELSRPKYQGRGYAHDGVRKAGKYVYRQFEKAGVDDVVFQPFTIDINTFGGKMEMAVDGRRLKAGRDFSMREYSPGVKGVFPVYYVDTLNYDSERLFSDLAKPENANCMVVCDFFFTYRHKEDFNRLQTAGEAQNAGLILTWNTPLKFYKAYGEKVVDKPIVWALSDAVSGIRSVRLDIENKFLQAYETSNVIARVDGRRHDSCYVFTAHYDHLGNLGKKVFYPGSNDNASGIAAIITLAEHFSKNQPEFDVYFIAFSGEEANLRGSRWYVNNPVVPLSQIRYLFNIDMIGDDNPSLYCELSQAGMPEFCLFEDINGEQKLFDSLERGELAANSDHYPFAENGVPCIFFMNHEGSSYPFYHTPNDNPETVRYESYPSVFKLICTFLKKL